MSELVELYPHLRDLPPTLDDTQAGTPARRPGSVRRTSTIDMHWPGGFGTPLHLVGRARDLLTPTSGEARVFGEAAMRAEMAEHRTVTAIEASPHREGISGLIGAVGGSELRTAIDRALPGEREAGTPLHLLLDDVAGASLISGFALSRQPEIRERMRAQGGFRAPAGSEPFGIRKGKVICSGLRPEGWFDMHRRHELPPFHAMVQAGALGGEGDPLAWHEFPADPEVGMRRHRRIDLWYDGDAIRIDAFFRDACWEPDGTQMALHEYTVLAAIDARDHTLRELASTPRVLPFPECRWAAPHSSELLGHPVLEFRTLVQQTLTELRACTHLNDMLRCFAEVPALARALGDPDRG